MILSRCRKHSRPIANEMTNSNHIIQTYTLRSGERDTFDCPQASHIPMIRLIKVNPQTIDAIIMSAVVIASFL
jgi:hypothetical protein